MFKIVEKRRTWWPVIFWGVKENGKPVENKIEMQFEILPEDDHLQLLLDAKDIMVWIEKEPQDEGGEAEAEPDADAPVSLSQAEARFAMRFAHDWKHVCEDDGSDDGKPLEFNEANLAKFFNLPNTFRATLEAYRKCREGAPEKRRGN